MNISIFNDGWDNVIPDRTITDWDEFVDLCTTPIVGAKNGMYWVRGECVPPRCDKNITRMDLIVIDGDQLLTDGSSCCPPAYVHRVMASRDIMHVLYSSYSHDIVNNRHKWRLCIPSPDLTCPADLIQGCAEIITLLHAAGLMVKNVQENSVVSQPWFTPRCTSATIEDFYGAWGGETVYRLGGVEIVPSARVGAITTPSPGGAQAGFSWDFVLGEFKTGTIHIGLKSAAGWLVRTTDWADSQIANHLISLVAALCPDQAKVQRAKDGEVLALVKYCREKSGDMVGDIDTSWKAHCITARELQHTVFPPLLWAVDGLVPEGLTILAGDPKVGKSLVAVDICAAIASGGKAFGVRQCRQGGAIYISLEDPARRVKDRIQKQCDLWPDAFRVVTGGAKIPICPVLDEMQMMYPDTRCIVIDTLQYIVPDRPASVTDYTHYYTVLDPVHQWALANHVAVIAITHKRKGQAQDIGKTNPITQIIGSVAIQGVADCILLLSREYGTGKSATPAAEGYLEVCGREVGTARLPVEYDDEAARWTLLPERVAPEGNLNWALITEALKTHPMTTKEISVHTKMNYSTTRSCVRRMELAGRLSYSEGGWTLASVCEGASLQPQALNGRGSAGCGKLQVTLQGGCSGVCE